MKWTTTCDHCGESIEIDGPKQNNDVRCPHCRRGTVV